MIENYVDCKEITQIMDYSHERMARWLCKSGHLATATKVGNSWIADRNEVLAYKLLMSGDRRGKKKPEKPGE